MLRKAMGMALALLMVFACGCALAEDTKAVVSAADGWVYLYEEASSKSDVAGQFLNGARVTIKNRPLEGWAEVKIGNLYGYMKTKNLKTGNDAERVEPQFWAGTISANKYARMRKGPSTEYQFVCNVDDGENVTIMGKTTKNWYYLEYKDKKGYISANMVYTRGSFDRTTAGMDEEEWYGWTEAPVPTVRSWQQAYTDYLLGIDGSSDTYALIYVNDDDIPELLIDSGVEATGCRILTYADGQVNVLTTRRLGFTYIERGNRLCNSDGSMDSYYDDVYEIRNGRWMCIARGEYFGYLSGWSDILQRYICRYYRWNGQATTLDQYLIALSAVYDSQRAIGVEEGYSKSAMLWKLGEMRG